MALMGTSDGWLELLEFRAGERNYGDDAPLVFTVVVPEYQGQTLILYTSEPFRNRWEFPGGAFEPGETPEGCAARELFEETGQIAAALTYKGLFKIHIVAEGRMEYAMLFTARLDALQPFTPNPEADLIMLWDRVSKLDADFGELHQALLAFC